MGNGYGKREGQGDKGTRGQGDKGTQRDIAIPNHQLPMPHAPCPITYYLLPITNS